MIVPLPYFFLVVHTFLTFAFVEELLMPSSSYLEELHQVFELIAFAVLHSLELTSCSLILQEAPHIFSMLKFYLILEVLYTLLHHQNHLVLKRDFVHYSTFCIHPIYFTSYSQPI